MSLQNLIRYAEADKSNPFAFNRAMSHHINGVTKRRYNPDTGESKACSYDAEEYQQVRVTEKGDEYKVIAYKNMVRP